MSALLSGVRSASERASAPVRGVRASGIVRALTQDAAKFVDECDPRADNLCLYGNSDGSWVVGLPAQEVPPELPEPVVGINFARDGMARDDWLTLVAVHSDVWLLSVAFYWGSKLTTQEREKLFKLVNKVRGERLSRRVRGARALWLNGGH